MGMTMGVSGGKELLLFLISQIDEADRILSSSRDREGTALLCEYPLLTN
jgi:hypothetical protein